MYFNLVNEMTRMGVTIEMIADFLELHRNTVSNKVNGASSFLVDEALAVREKFFPYADFQYLFRKVYTERKAG